MPSRCIALVEGNVPVSPMDLPLTNASTSQPMWVPQNARRNVALPRGACDMVKDTDQVVLWMFLFPDRGRAEPREGGSPGGTPGELAGGTPAPRSCCSS